MVPEDQRTLLERNLKDAIANTGLFDQRFDLETYTDVAESGIDPTLHFAEDGWKEGRRPNAFFDPAFYLAEYPDVQALGVNPLVHFAEHGLLEGRRGCSISANLGWTPPPPARPKRTWPRR